MTGVSKPSIDETAESQFTIEAILLSGSKQANEVFAMGDTHGFSKQIMRKAATNLKVIKGKEGFGGEGSWNWSLPNAP